MEKGESPIEIEKGAATPEQIEEIKEGRYFSIKQLAETLGYSVAWITFLCQKGRIKAMKPLGGSWRIPPSEVARIKREGVPPLPRQQPAVDATEIRVEGPHLERVKAQEKKEEKKRTIKWPLSLLFGEEEKEE